MSDEPDLLKPDTEVTDKELQIELGNLNAENEALKISYKALLESSTAVTNNLRQELQKVRSQLETERADREEVETQLSDREAELAELRSELSDLKQKSATAGKELPHAADLLNQLKAKRKKAKTDLVDMEAILDILEG